MLSSSIAIVIGPAPPRRGVVGKREKEPDRSMRVPITIEVPPGELTPLPTNGGPVATVELRIGAQDAEGNTAAIPVIPLQLQLKGPVEAGDAGRYRTDLLLRRAEHDLVVALYEPVSGKVFSATARIAP